MCGVCSRADIAKRTDSRVCLAWLENASGLENLLVGVFCAKLYNAHTDVEVGVALIAMSWYRAHGNYDTWCGSWATILPDIISTIQLQHTCLPISLARWVCRFFNLRFKSVRWELRLDGNCVQLCDRWVSSNESSSTLVAFVWLFKFDQMCDESYVRLCDQWAVRCCCCAVIIPTVTRLSPSVRQ